MPASAKGKARDAFELNMKDAYLLVELAHLLENRRVKRMRIERRRRIGSALDIPKKRWDEIECIENSQVFITLLPGSAELRHELVADNLRPLLRQSIVAACAAVETFVADRAMELYPRALKKEPLPSRLASLPMSVGQWRRIEDNYRRRGAGVRAVVDASVRLRASAAPSVIGEVFLMMGEDRVFARIDAERKVAKGDSERRLAEIVQRRNRIAHSGDRAGLGRAALSVAETEAILDDVESIVAALDRVTSPAPRTD